MRVIAGSLKGRRLKSPTWEGLRPTSDKLRETLFNVLAPRVVGARVLDGYAGTGAVGIEALSRGAAARDVRRVGSPRAGAHRREPAACGIETGYTMVRSTAARALVDARWQTRRSRRSTSFCSTRRTTSRPARRWPAWTRLLAPAGGSCSNMRAGRAARPRRTPRSRTRSEIRRQRAGLLHMPTLAVYPGSFDPLTNGHVDIITRGARLFDRIIVAILVNAEKAPLFSMDERLEIAREVFKDLPNVEVDTFDGLLVDYVERRRAQVIVRGLRAVSDFEFEFQMALMNRRLNGKIETVFMMPAEQYSYISSRLIKEVFSLGGRVHGLVPDMVEERLRQKVNER